MADDTTQTTPPNDAEVEPPATSETPGEGERAGPSKDEYHARQALEHKVKAEQLNALLSSYGVNTVEELNERLEQSPAAPAPRTTPDAAQVDWSQVEEWARKGDAVAQAQIENRNRLDSLEHGIVNAFTAERIKDPAEKQQAIALMQRFPNRYGDLQAALAAVREPKLAAENAKLRDELAKMKKGPDPDVMRAPKTAGREIPATEPTGKKMTLAQLEKEAQALVDSGRPHAAMLLRRDAEIVQ